MVKKGSKMVDEKNIKTVICDRGREKPRWKCGHRGRTELYGAIEGGVVRKMRRREGKIAARDCCSLIIWLQPKSPPIRVGDL